jgi:DNA-binding response OmpR family regulator
MPETIFIVKGVESSHSLESYLEQAGYRVRLFGDEASTLSEATNQPPALFILDIVLPEGEDGLALCRRIRKQQKFSACRVMFVTAKTEEADRVSAFETGADEYITSPFSPRELIARIKAVLRRYPEPERPVLKIGELEIDMAAMTARCRGKLLETTTTEFRILAMLATFAGRVVSRDRLLERVWGNREVGPRSIDVYISRVRGKIERDPAHPTFLRTVRGVGYRLGER